MTERYDLRRDNCANLSQDRMYLHTAVGQDVDGCTLTLGAANEVLTEAGIPLTYRCPQADGRTFLVDTAGSLTGRVTIGGAYGAPAVGLHTVDVVVHATQG